MTSSLAGALTTALALYSGVCAAGAGAVEPADPVSFAAATAGFSQCRLGDLYIDEYSGATRNAWLRSQEDKRCDQDDQLASYCINERFHDLAVSRLAVPKTTLPVFALYFTADLATARAALSRALGSEFRPSTAVAQGSRPELLADPEDSRRSVLCAPGSSKKRWRK
ncbi:hypothetical protein FJU30_05615 [Affinibrenneria salicis]|uniref:Uncharacterized protein n=1 Tax=Affinibrenneria salicis TaxID=2590031 RepID=A0A5J5G416_9GAMM|nr:hypothetical protein [Affinibrenneria salicis]KAA9001768.1 hypothetical protein FJU30_05615 [Affinibrenneria salicis]